MNLNTQIKKNAISFDIDFENIKQNTLTTKHDNKQPKKAEVIPNVEDPEEANKEQTLYKCPNCERTLREKHMQSMFQFVQEYSITKIMKKIAKMKKIKKRTKKMIKKVSIRNQNGKIKVMN